MILVGAKNVFISYNHKDSMVAEKLKLALEKKGILVTIDNETMRAGASIQEFIESSIRDADVTLSIVSNHSLLSAWVAMESSTAFYGEKFQSGKKFIACYIDDDFFNPSFREKATLQIDAQIKEINEQVQKHIALGIDFKDLNDDVARLYKLRSGLGEILQKLKGSLTLNVQEAEFDKSVARIVQAIEDIPIRP